jgi:hypothetical protein
MRILLALSGGKPRPTEGFCLTHRMHASTMAVGCFCLFSPKKHLQPTIVGDTGFIPAVEVPANN